MSNKEELTLRDQFAMACILAVARRSDGATFHHNEIAVMAYVLADALINVRNGEITHKDLAYEPAFRDEYFPPFMG